MKSQVDEELAQRKLGKRTISKSNQLTINFSEIKSSNDPLFEKTASNVSFVANLYVGSFVFVNQHFFEIKLLGRLT